MKPLILFLSLAICLICSAETVTYEYKDNNGGINKLNAVLRLPEGSGKKKAIVILHHSGGFSKGTTTQYADFFVSKNFVTIEPIIFSGKSIPYEDAIPQVFATLDYLSNRDEVLQQDISLMGLSYGGLLTTIAATDWANKKYSSEGKKFKRFAPLYSLCWVGTRFITRNTSSKSRGLSEFFPDDFMDKWVGAPMLILSGADDNYEDRDAQICQKFIDVIPDANQREVSKSIVFKDTTHGWDHQSAANFYTPNACKGNGCTNSNRPNYQSTQKGKEELLIFFNTD